MIVKQFYVLTWVLLTEINERLNIGLVRNLWKGDNARNFSDRRCVEWIGFFLLGSSTPSGGWGGWGGWAVQPCSEPHVTPNNFKH